MKLENLPEVVVCKKLCVCEGEGIEVSGKSLMDPHWHRPDFYIYLWVVVTWTCERW